MQELLVKEKDCLQATASKSAAGGACVSTHSYFLVFFLSRTSLQATSLATSHVLHIGIMPPLSLQEWCDIAEGKLPTFVQHCLGFLQLLPENCGISTACKQIMAKLIC